jgi:hypothetical protein
MIKELGKMLEKCSVFVRKPILEILVLFYRDIGSKLLHIIGTDSKVAYALVNKRMRSEVTRPMNCHNTTSEKNNVSSRARKKSDIDMAFTAAPASPNSWEVQDKHGENFLGNIKNVSPRRRTVFTSVKRVLSPRSCEKDQDLATSLEMRRVSGLVKLQELFDQKEEENLHKDVNRVVSNLSGWFYQLVEERNTDVDQGTVDVMIKLIEVMSGVSGHTKLLRTLRIEVLEKWIKALLLALISSSLRARYPNKRFIITKLNSITLAVIKNCDRGFAICILIGLLKEARPFPTTKKDQPLHSTQFSNLVVKCLQTIQAGIADNSRHIDVAQVLQAMHEFYTRRQRSEWKQQGANEKPFLCVKQCLTKFCDTIGIDIYSHAKLLADNEESLLIILIRQYFSNANISTSNVSLRDVLERAKEKVPSAIHQLYTIIQDGQTLCLDTLMAGWSDQVKSYIQDQMRKLDNLNGTQVIPKAVKKPHSFKQSLRKTTQLSRPKVSWLQKPRSSLTSTGELEKQRRKKADPVRPYPQPWNLKRKIGLPSTQNPSPSFKRKKMFP